MFGLGIGAVRAAGAFSRTKVAVFLFGAIVGATLTIYEAHGRAARVAATHAAELSSRDAAKALNDAALSDARAKGYETALGLVEEQQRLLSEQATNVRLAIDGIPSALAKERAHLRSTFEELTRDPKYDCRRLPLPDGVLDRLRRPGADDLRPADDYQGPAVPAAPAGVSLGTSPRPSGGFDQ